MDRMPKVVVADHLEIRVGRAVARVTPSEALDFAETVARSAFRAAMREEISPPHAAKPARRRVRS